MVLYLIISHHFPKNRGTQMPYSLFSLAFCGLHRAIAHLSSFISMVMLPNAEIAHLSSSISETQQPQGKNRPNRQPDAWQRLGKGKAKGPKANPAQQAA
ncbi:hypothetical protein [Paenibacillus mucilaginosus]|uniref:hypothetical protein n=1 Tax=Paenibacillus mucilaginosus TaxID=61624 RepID=UPI003D1B606B